MFRATLLVAGALGLATCVGRGGGWLGMLLVFQSLALLLLRAGVAVLVDLKSAVLVFGVVGVGVVRVLLLRVIVAAGGSVHAEVVYLLIRLGYRMRDPA